MTRLNIQAAPIQGYTDCVWREAHASIFGGVETYYSPFLRIEKGEFRKRDLSDINPANNTAIHLIPQIIACTPIEASNLVAKIADMGYKEVDINLGCPFPLITRKHKGSGMLPYPQEIKELFSHLSQFHEITFSIKMRLGLESNSEWKSITPLFDIISPSHITIHPRTASQQYRGNVDMTAFDEFYNTVKYPIIYNGDILSPSDIERIESAYPKLSAIMIGRRLLTNPALSADTRNTAAYIKFHDTLFSAYSQSLCGDAHLLAKMKSFWQYFLADGDKKLHKKIIKSGSISHYNDAVINFWSSLDS